KVTVPVGKSVTTRSLRGRRKGRARLGPSWNAVCTEPGIEWHSDGKNDGGGPAPSRVCGHLPRLGEEDVQWNASPESHRGPDSTMRPTGVSGFGYPYLSSAFKEAPRPYAATSSSS